MLEEDDNGTRTAVALLKDLFHCDMEPHAQQVAYMARSPFYLRWNTRLSSQCTAPSRINQQKSRKPWQGPGHEKPQGRQKGTRQTQEPHHDIVDHKEKVQVGGKRLNQSEDRHQRQKPFSGGKENNRPYCDDTSFVSDVCRHSSLHVAKVRHLDVLGRTYKCFNECESGTWFHEKK